MDALAYGGPVWERESFSRTSAPSRTAFWSAWSTSTARFTLPGPLTLTPSGFQRLFLLAWLVDEPLDLPVPPGPEWMTPEELDGYYLLYQSDADAP